MFQVVEFMWAVSPESRVHRGGLMSPDVGVFTMQHGSESGMDCLATSRIFKLDCQCQSMVDCPMDSKLRQ